MPYDSLKGKRLLILVGGPNMVSLVERAKELEVYTIVTDYYSVSDSPAKKIADEYWNISWSDIDALETRCRSEKIDGVTTGYSETPVACCIELCKRLGLPFYCTEQQLAITSDKYLFKQECRKNDVPVIKEFSDLSEVNHYPVIVKPVDRAGSIGVGIANNYYELVAKYSEAMKKSYVHRVIIEEYITTGSKFDATYAIIDGEPLLVADCDTINAKDNGYERVVQSAWLFPSKYHNAFVLKTDELLKQMIRNMDIKDGYIFFSGFAIDGKDGVEFKFFESGFRLSGEHVHSYLSAINRVEILDLFIVHALTGSTKQISCNPFDDNDSKCVMINYYAKRGTISRIIGVNRVKQIDDCIFLLHPARLGQTCDNNKAILSKLCLTQFCNQSAYELAKDVQLSNEYYSVLDEHEIDMVYDRVDGSVIASWW